MSRVIVALTSAFLAGAALVAIPASPAGSATSCIAWASLPSRVSLAGQEVVVRATLHGSAACQGVTTDNGGSATLNGPGRSTSDFPLRWSRLDTSDTAPFYASLNTLGTYRISGGDLQTYDAGYLHIPFEWRTTSTVVKYAGRFADISRQDATIRAQLQYYAKVGWQAHAGVTVKLQRHSSSGWHTVTQKPSSSSGRVAFRATSGTYRLVSATTGSVWSATAGLARV